MQMRYCTSCDEGKNLPAAKTRQSLTYDPDQFFLENYCQDEHHEILPGVKWGNYCQLFTPAFWKYLYVNHRIDDTMSNHRLGNSILEEVVACLLGGYGMPSEIGILAFERLKNECLIEPGINYELIHKALSVPLQISTGSFKMYRFYNQKSKFIYNFLNRNDLEDIPYYDDFALRNWLLTVKGIGLKTASWITRNWLKSENVAILDIHILRAGKMTGFFKHMDATRHYYTLEKDFIDFCVALDARPSDMDALIWNYMKKTNILALRLLNS